MAVKHYIYSRMAMGRRTIFWRCEKALKVAARAGTEQCYENARDCGRSWRLEMTYCDTIWFGALGRRFLLRCLLLAVHLPHVDALIEVAKKVLEK